MIETITASRTAAPPSDPFERGRRHVQLGTLIATVAFAAFVAFVAFGLLPFRLEPMSARILRWVLPFLLHLLVCVTEWRAKSRDEP